MEEFKTFLKNVQRRHPKAKCVCLHLKVTLPLNSSTNVTFYSYLRVFFDSCPIPPFFSEISMAWFLIDETGFGIIKHMFPQKIFSLNYFKEVMEKGCWSWIPVNDPEQRYQTLWGGTLPIFGRPNYEKMDYEMHYPSDEDVKF